MRYLVKIGAAWLVVLVLVAGGLAAVAEAQEYSTSRRGGREGNWEFLLPLIYTDSARINGSNGSSVDVNADWGFGFGFGYNFTDNFQLNGLFNWSYRSYEATIVQTDGTSRRYNNYMDTSNLSLNGTYYFLKGNFTPFLSAGVGIAYWDTNIPTGVGSTYCYWDPWWGYVCGGYVPTKSENDVSYNAGVGIRYDVNRQFGLQASFNRTWINVSRAQGIPDFDNWRLDFIFRM